MKNYSVVICGGGSTYTLPLIKTLCEYKDTFNVNEIRLFDISKEKQEPIFQAAKIMAKELMTDIKISSHYDDSAFSNVDFAFLQIRSGGFEMREKDEKIPLSYGCVGQETCGAGGFAYGLRSIKEVISIIESIREKSKDAWIINYSNPAAIVAVATQQLFPEDKRIINLCDMPIAMMDGFAEALGMKRQDFTPRYFGLNHFGWFTNLYDRSGNDVLPLIKNKLKQGVLMPEELSEDSGWIDTFDQLKTMVEDIDGHLPNTYLQYYLYPDKIVEESDKEYTRANYVMDHRLKDVKNTANYIIDNRTIQGSGLERGVHGTYIVELANSLTSNTQRTFITIVKNDGIIPNLPYDAMVEVPCLITRNGVEPLHVGPIDTFYKGLLENQYAYEKLAVRAALTNSYQDALKALILNRTVVDTDKAKLILKDLMTANSKYWNIGDGM